MKTALKAALVATAILSTPAILAEDNDVGVNAGGQHAASIAAEGSTATIVAGGVGALAVVGAVVGGSSDNGSGTSTATSTSTH